MDGKSLLYLSLLSLAAFSCGSSGGGGDADADAAEEIETGDTTAGEETAAVCGNAAVEGGEECDDGNDAAGDGCEDDCTWTCREETGDADCDDGHGCTQDSCAAATHTCRHEMMGLGALCRPAAGECDLPEACDGSGADCPADAHKAGGERCRPAAGTCDVAESCDGTSAACPADGFKPSGDVCDPADECSFPNRCDGAGPSCPNESVNVFQRALSVAAGYAHACAVVRGGGAACWGSNERGQLGDGSGASSSGAPVDVTGLSAGVAAVAPGGDHTCALLSAGGVLCWGGNDRFQLGNGPTTDSATPVGVAALTAGVRQLAAGMFHTCAVVTGGAVRCWGSNSQGQVGSGSTDDGETPVAVASLGSGAAAVAAGAFHTCALTTGGGLSCWGYNDYGQLGNGTLDTARTPVRVAGLTAGAAAVAAGGMHSCAITSAGGLRCWGRNGDGQLGDGTKTDRPSPVAVGGLTGGVAAVVAGWQHTCALTSAGDLRCWGMSAWGAVGGGSTADRTTPEGVPGASGAVAAAAGAYFTCALTTAGSVRCWGENGSGQLGRGTSLFQPVPVDVAGLPPAASLSVGLFHACVLASSGGPACWGSNLRGELGDGSGVLPASPVAVSGIAAVSAFVDAGLFFTCAAPTGGGMQCWGGNAAGNLGNGSTDGTLVPVPVLGLPEPVVQADAGGFSMDGSCAHACAVLAGGAVRCWGCNSSGQLGRWNTTDSATPVGVVGLSAGAALVSAGALHTCALAGGAVRCWGSNGHGQLGDGTFDDVTTPVQVLGLTAGVAAVSAGAVHTCAVAGSAALCWGNNDYGQLGTGTFDVKASPVPVQGLTSGVLAISAGARHTCALAGGGAVACWGANDFGALGDGTFTSRRIPGPVLGLTSGVAAIAAGGDFPEGIGQTCALMSGGSVKCWGTDLYGGVTGAFSGWPRPVVCR